ncbi:DgyrCDS12178 [Dimorphilus gyrociliatus]|uniref:DgyrCDS12178 n=1 Tax=Dimorphilus gyrociliatus TaxID=2664684 RepID=A0A7I8W8H8_9ANNE|nr:DgyrCDS12178 [Dimorphilus gyrociliatus]
MNGTITAAIEYDGDQDNIQKVIDLDSSMTWDDFRMIICCMLLCENYRVYYLDDENEEVIVSSNEEFQQTFKIAKESNSIHFRIVAANFDDPLSVYYKNQSEKRIDEIHSNQTALKSLREEMSALHLTPPPPITPVDSELNCAISFEEDHTKLTESKEIQANLSDLEQKSNVSRCVMTEVTTEDSASQATIEPTNSSVDEPEWFHSSMEKYMIRLERLMKRESLQKARSVEVQTAEENGYHKNIDQEISAIDLFDMKPTDDYSEEANVVCDNCQCFIIGNYFKCANCANYNLCLRCEEFSEQIHLNSHVFLKLKIPLPFSALKRDRFGNLKPLLKRNLYEIRTKKMKKRRQASTEFHLEKKSCESQIENSPCLRRRRVNLNSSDFIRKTNHKLDAFFIGDCSHPDGTEVLPGTEFTKAWVVLNTGEQEWDNSVAITYLYGNLPATQANFSVRPVKPKDSGVIEVDLQAPLEPGHYSCHWILTRHGEQFGKRVWCSIVVPSPSDHSSCLEEEIPLLNQSFEYIENLVDTDEQPESIANEDDKEETSSIDSEFLIIPMPDCFDVTKPITTNVEIEKKTVDDILAVSSHIKLETLEPEIAPPPSAELEELSEILDEEETNNEEAIFVDAQEISSEYTPVDVTVEKCEIHLPEPSQNTNLDEVAENENQPAFYQKAIGVLNKVAKGAASAAVGTTKNVFQTLQAQQAYIPPRSSWTPPKTSEIRPVTDEEWITQREDAKRDDMDNLIAMGFANRQLNSELLKKHTNLDAVVDELINRQENPIRQ